jgi:hypothetical protein
MSKPTYVAKKLMILKIARELSVDFSSIIAKYEDQYFKDSSIHKYDFFKELLEDQLTGASETFINSRCNLTRLRDNRTPLEYGKELAIGWLMEDVILEAISRTGINIELQGFDQRREFLDQEQISARSDYWIKLGEELVSLELVTSWTSYWQSSDKLDLRASKFKSMVTKAERTLCLGVEAPSLNGFCIDMQKDQELFESKPNPAWGFKPSHTLEGISSKLVSLKDAVELIRTV